MKISKIIIGKEYHLDLGSLAPVHVKVISIDEKKEEVLVKYLNSTPGRTERLSFYFFK